ncbi:uncharacterized protein LOC100393185 [Callithrix jacchus]
MAGWLIGSCVSSHLRVTAGATLDSQASKQHVKERQCLALSASLKCNSTVTVHFHLKFLDSSGLPTLAFQRDYRRIRRFQKCASFQE